MARNKETKGPTTTVGGRGVGAAGDEIFELRRLAAEAACGFAYELAAALYRRAGRLSEPSEIAGLNEAMPKEGTE